MSHQHSTLNYLSAVVSHEGGSTLRLLNHFLKLCAEHVHLFADQIATERNPCHADAGDSQHSTKDYRLLLDLLIHDLDLLVDHPAGEAIDRHACLAVGSLR
jgi:hypothetical protein